MHIRTITAGAREEDIQPAAAAAHAAKRRLEDAGYTVQTLRLALSATGSNRCADFPALARGIEQRALDLGFDFVSLGRVAVDRLPQLAEAIATTEIVTGGARIAGRDGLADARAIRAAAEAIVAIGRATAQGFGNFRFAALACVPPGSPFFPAAWHDGGVPWIAVGPEAAALAVEATQTADDAPQTTDDEPSAVRRPSPIVHPALRRLTGLIEEHDRRIMAALARLEAEHQVYAAGCDWSLAPSPDPACSIGAAIEALSGAPFGAWGTLAAVRDLTEAIRSARVNRLGFSGVMLPALEDATLARRSLEGRYTLRDLLAFSAVCGTGLDTIPLPGDTTPEQAARVLSEVAALAGALRKPLTARLMPLPGRAAGEPTGLDLSGPMAQFLCEARVLPVA